MYSKGRTFKKPLRTKFVVEHVSAKTQAFLRAILPVLWCLFEWLRIYLFSGYPWLWEGYALSNSVFFSLAPFIGALGLTFLAVSIGVFAYSIYKKSHFSSVFLGVFLSLSSVSATYLSFNVEEDYDDYMNVAVVQANIPQEIKWLSSFRESIVKVYEGLIDQAVMLSDTVILPETAIPMSVDYNSKPAVFNKLNEDFYAQNKSLITGFVKIENGMNYNSVGVFGKSYSDANFYNKEHLLPFGEYLPYRNLISKLFNTSLFPSSDFSRGVNYNPYLEFNNHYAYPVICFEIAFPDQLLRNFSQASDFILHLSNDTWFGFSAGPDQHVQVSQMRAAEFGRSLVRTNNNGYTALIDPSGKVIKQSIKGKRYVLNFFIPISHKKTFFSQYGHKPILLFCFFTIFLCLVFRFVFNFKLKKK